MEIEVHVEKQADSSTVSAKQAVPLDNEVVESMAWCHTVMYHCTASSECSDICTNSDQDTESDFQHNSESS